MMDSLQNYSKTTQKIIDKVKCPYQVFTTEHSIPEDVQEAYEKAVEEGKKKGFVPVLVISDETLDEWLGILEDEEYSKEKILSKERQDGKEILNQRFEEYTEDFEDEYDYMGEKEEGEEISELSAFVNFEDDVVETILFEVPVKNPWEVIAWFPMGGWNECPEASEMMAVCRYWYEKYGAVPAVISHDELEFTVENLDACKENAWELAKEHYAFCPDRVDQGTHSGTIGEVADCISKSNVWYFWWD